MAIVIAGREYVAVDCIKVVAIRQEITNAFLGKRIKVCGQRLERRHPKTKGKAEAKRAKRARQQTRRLARAA
jgi:hypothetical protein